MSYYTALRGPDILRNGIVSGYVTFYKINEFFLYIYIYYSFIIDKIASHAG